MSSYVGLYYPYLHFQDENWLKSALLYWDRMGRIVPDRHVLRDSDSVKKLQNELDFVTNYAPGWDAIQSVGQTFLAFMNDNLAELYAQYGLSELGGNTISYVLGRGKMMPELKDALLESKLATKEKQDVDGRFFGMHPVMCDVYMTALAQTMAASDQLCPLADSMFDHARIGDCSVDWLSAVLLDRNGSQHYDHDEDEIQYMLATVAIGMAVPADMGSVSLEKIIQLRENHREELTAFQDELRSLSHNNSWLSDVTSEEVLREHIGDIYRKKLAPSLSKVEAGMKSLGIDTFTGLWDLRFIVPTGISGVTSLIPALSLQPVCAVVGGVAMGLHKVLKKKQKEIRDVIQAQPASYLFYAKEELQPAGFAEQFTQSVRRFTFGV